MTELYIDQVFPNSSNNPVIVNFQNGYTNDIFQTTECTLLSDNNTHRKSIVTSLDGIIYAGEEQDDDLMRTLVVVRDNDTGKVRVIETCNADLKPVLKHEMATTNLEETSNLELSRKFGSKRQKKQMEQREKLKINTYTVAKQMEQVAVNITQEDLDVSSYTKSDSEEIYIPPINREATRVEDVYDIYKILSNEQFEKIYSEIETKDFMSDIVPLVKNVIINKTLTNEQTVLAVYASTLMKMYAATSREFSRKSFIICPVSNTLNEITLANFTQFINNRRTRPNTLKDKALCHCIVLILTLNNFKFELEALAVAAKVTPLTASTKAKAVGAHITTSGNAKFVQLKLPLNTKTTLRRRKSAKF